MKRILSSLLSVLIVSFIMLFVMMLVFSYTGKNEDNRHLDVEIKGEGLSGYQPFGSAYRYVKTPGKYDEIELNLQFRAKDKSALFITSADIVTEGIEYDRKQFENHLRFRDVKVTDPEGFRIYIPKGTVVTYEGYALQEDFFIQNVKLIEPDGSMPLESLSKLFKISLLALIASVVLHLLGILGSVKGNSNRKLEFDRGVFNMAICIPVTVLILVLLQLFKSQIGQGSYDNEIGIILLMSIFLVPLGTLVIYKILVTFYHNIKEGGLIAGVGITLLQFIAVFSVIYVIAIVVAFWAGLGTAPLRQRRL